MMSGDRKEIIVIGAGTLITTVGILLSSLETGVVGLSTAIRVQETGKYNVTIVAETFPTDPPTIRYTSHWAVSIP